MLNINQKIKSSLGSRYCAEACNEWRDTTSRHSAWAIHLRRSVVAVASRWRHCVQFDRPGNRANNLPRPLRRVYLLGQQSTRNEIYPGKSDPAISNNFDYRFSQLRKTIADTIHEIKKSKTKKSKKTLGLRRNKDSPQDRVDDYELLSSRKDAHHNADEVEEALAILQQIRKKQLEEDRNKAATDARQYTSISIDKLPLQPKDSDPEDEL